MVTQTQPRVAKVARKIKVSKNGNYLGTLLG